MSVFLPVLLLACYSVRLSNRPSLHFKGDIVRFFVAGVDREEWGGVGGREDAVISRVGRQDTYMCVGGSMHAHTCTQTQAQTHTSARARTHARTLSHTRARAHTHTHTRVRARAHTHTHTHTHARARTHPHPPNDMCFPSQTSRQYCHHVTVCRGGRWRI